MKKARTNQKNSKIRVGLVVPHIFMQRDILPHVIFSPGKLALELADGLQQMGADVTLFSPGPVDTIVTNISADMSLFEQELSLRGDSYLDLLKKHPFTFITLARQIQSEVIAKAYEMANDDRLDIVHIYTNEEDIALPFAKFCKKQVVFTHHDPFNFLVKYKNLFPKYKDLNWVSMSFSQRHGMPEDTNWVGNIYHGLLKDVLVPIAQPTNDYMAYLGRIVEPKGLHLAIQAIRQYNVKAKQKMLLKIVGKHYAGHKKDTYWQTKIEPELGGEIEYIGFIPEEKKASFLGNAAAVVVPSIFNEPFGMVAIEALACATPVIALDSGALPEIISNGITGILAHKIIADDGKIDEAATIQNIAHAITKIQSIDRDKCREDFEERFTLDRMCSEHLVLYEKLIQSPGRS
ncbi:MAG TPA: glycosyltransferase [Candidatus Saccharimonadales bacterium]|nr:glycosyltransferase [Candidatus Saccharimonadales bacterium]